MNDSSLVCSPKYNVYTSTEIEYSSFGLLYYKGMLNCVMVWFTGSHMPTDHQKDPAQLNNTFMNDSSLVYSQKYN